jgi:hypothetical protein
MRTRFDAETSPGPRVGAAGPSLDGMMYELLDS